MQANRVDKSPAASGPVLDVRGLKTHFFTRNGVVRAVDGVDLHLAAGEILGLVGESAPARASPASLMGLLDEPGRIVDGSIRFNGEELRGATPPAGASCAGATSR